MTKLTQEKLIRLRDHKAPVQRDMPGKSADPGQPISWTRHHDGHHEPNPVADIYGTRWIPGTSETMTGVIWSAGPEANSVWAQLPDGSMQALKLPSARYAAAGHGPMEMPGYPATWQRDTIQRCENLRRSAGIVAEYDTYAHGYGNAGREHVVSFHADSACSEITHDTRPASPYEPSVRIVTDLLLSAGARGRSDLCRRCIYLTEQGVTEAAEAA